MNSRIPVWFFHPSIVSLALLGVFAGTCIAPETPREPRLAQRGPLAENYLRNRLVVWQDRLNLEDWNISLVMSHPSNLRRGTLGNVRWDVDQKTAVIRVLDASEYQKPFVVALKDMEFTVVHELIHLNFAPVVSDFQRSDANRREEEHAVNHMADALLKMDRKP